MNATLVVSKPNDAHDWAAAARLLEDYFAWLAIRMDIPNVGTVQPHAWAELEDLEMQFNRPGRSLLLAYQGRLPVGICAVKPATDGDRGEIVRMFTRATARGQGIGALLLDTVIAEARSLGYRDLVLDTHPAAMGAAVALYERHGFVLADEPHELPVDGGVRFTKSLR